MSLPRLAADLAAGCSLFSEIIELLEDEWAPEAPPVTVSMSELGRALIERAGTGFSLEDIAEIFRRVEHIMECGAEAERDALATGFLEAIAAAIDRSPQSRWVLEYAGPGAREYLAAWDQFCGVDRDAGSRV
jgi:hypothetical protein